MRNPLSVNAGETPFVYDPRRAGADSQSFIRSRGRVAHADQAPGGSDGDDGSDGWETLSDAEGSDGSSGAWETLSESESLGSADS